MARMAIHSEDSFNEAEEIRILSNKLEEKRRIKTFFKENDKTPNTDGFFELVAEDKTPQKQFVVQIKKVNSLEKKEKAEKPGKYPYDLETKFLYYIKEKVTENPAIYFVVDIDTNTIYSLYLSDEKLMSLDFENKGTVRYWFQKEDILDDVEVFYRKMLEVSLERNKMFVNKSPQEIMELQDAADYINTLFLGDFKTIKDFVFPDLWRFGIGYTQSCEVKVGHKSIENPSSNKSTVENANLFGLYPQIKGKFNPEIGEYREDSIFKSFDFTNQITPMKYSEDVVHKTIKCFCENPPLEVLPTIILKEMAFQKMNTIHTFVGDGECHLIDEAIKDFYIMLSYLDYILDDKSALQETDSQKRTMLLNLLNRGCRHCVGLSNFLIWGNIKEFAKSQRDKDSFPIKKEIFDYVSLEDLGYIFLLHELKKRKENNIDYLRERFEESANLESERLFFEHYYNDVIQLYHETYNKIFDSNKYLFSRKVFYSLEHEGKAFYMLSRVDVAPKGIIELNYTDAEALKNDEKYSGLGICYHLMNGFNVGMTKNTLLYDGVRCLLYQGICEALGFECQGLSINGINTKIFV